MKCLRTLKTCSNLKGHLIIFQTVNVSFVNQSLSNETNFSQFYVNWRHSSFKLSKCEMTCTMSAPDSESADVSAGPDHCPAPDVQARRGLFLINQSTKWITYKNIKIITKKMPVLAISSHLLPCLRQSYWDLRWRPCNRNKKNHSLSSLTRYFLYP
jgi:hypothetical protein